MNIKVNEPVHIRTRKLSNGNETIYLDIIVDGKRKQEYLKLYLLAGDSREIKNRNRETMSLANAVKAKRIVEIQNGRFDFENKDKSDIPFIEWMKNVLDGSRDIKSDNY
jgi:hypothetical protein